ncbi:MAG: cell wall metabolism sensor histidine kinase WalK [Chloroflexota bacterium]|nr:cell wall metabolism sensor histidine kinase WalK [Chloroflexota bacterium]
MDSWAEEPVEELVGLADLIGLGLVRFDQWLVVRLANERAHALLGRAGDALPGLSASEAFGDHRVEVILWTALAQGAASAELTLRDEGSRTLLLRARRSATGGAWLALEDVSELRRLQRIRAEFIDNLSHELRTPLTNVRLLTETLALELDGTDLPPRIREGIQKIDVETGHLVQMVSQLLDLSRIEQGSSPLHFEDVDIAALARASLERVRLFAERHGIALRTELPGGLPPVRGDGDRLGQLLINLLHNAVKFSPPGTAVIVRASHRPHEVVVSVADQGVGIPAADLERVFERFYKVDKARVRGQGGTGLGLAIARHIAESHGGRIWVESEEGVGSTLSFAIPTSTPGAMLVPRG